MHQWTLLHLCQTHWKSTSTFPQVCQANTMLMEIFFVYIIISYFVALRARIYSWKSMVPLPSSSNTRKIESPIKLAWSPRADYNQNYKSLNPDWRKIVTSDSSTNKSLVISPEGHSFRKLVWCPLITSSDNSVLFMSKATWLQQKSVNKANI